MIGEASIVPTPPTRAAIRAAWMAFGVGGAYAAVSAYWGLGGTALLDTLGGQIGRLGRSGSADAVVLVWTAAVVKLVAAILPLRTLRLARPPAVRRRARVLTWTLAGALTIYGAIFTGGGLLVQAAVVTPPKAAADQRALAWHAFLWDPWFLLWGILVTIAMAASRHPDGGGAAGSDLELRPAR